MKVKRNIELNTLLEEMRKSFNKPSTHDTGYVLVKKEILKDAYDVIEEINKKVEVKEFATKIAEKLDSSIDVGLKWTAKKAKLIKDEFTDDVHPNEDVENNNNVE